MIGRAEFINRKPVMDYEAVRDNLNACGRQEQELCEKCKYHHSRDCRSRLIFEAEVALSNLIKERDERNGGCEVDQDNDGHI